jgi:hypothetical protein
MRNRRFEAKSREHELDRPSCSDLLHHQRYIASKAVPNSISMCTVCCDDLKYFDSRQDICFILRGWTESNRIIVAFYIDVSFSELTSSLLTSAGVLRVVVRVRLRRCSSIRSFEDFVAEYLHLGVDNIVFDVVDKGTRCIGLRNKSHNL